MEDWEIIGTVRNVRRGDCYVLYFMVENKGYAWYNQNVKNVDKSEFVERFPELSLFFKAYSLLDSEMICIFPYLCPYAESAREIREIFS